MEERGSKYEGEGDGNSESLIRLGGIEASVFGRNEPLVYLPDSSRIMLSGDERGRIIFSTFLDHLPRPPVPSRGVPTCEKSFRRSFVYFTQFIRPGIIPLIR